MNELERNDLYEKSDNDIIVQLGLRFREYRIALRLTQKDVARQSGVSVMTIVRFERGEGCSIRMDNFVALMRAIQKLDGISECIPFIPQSLYASDRSKKVIRVRKTVK